MNERLTARSPKNGLAYLVGVKDDEQGIEGSYNTLMCVRGAFEALATYEETGFSPEEISMLGSHNKHLKLQLENLKTASKEATEILGDMVDVAKVAGSAYLYRRDIENVSRVVKALIEETE